MKTKLLFSVIIVMFLSITSCGNDEDNLASTRSYDPEVMTSRACFNMERPKDAYLYPVVPGTDEWSALHELCIKHYVFRILLYEKCQQWD